MTHRHLIVGTAGHIDHGKSALVKALTGIDPDRLRQEKDRGITIELGFAETDLGSGRILSFVDVPGHERFVRHMVAGATGLDAVMLVIAADDGVRPQTKEHLDICTLLDIHHGLVVLSKCDAVEEEIREVVALEVREFLAGTFLAKAPLVTVSARTGEGMQSVREALEGLFEVVPERFSGGPVRLPVDRSFVLHGFGTVVTGTLASGTLREGDELEVMPGGRKGRVRGLQVHRHRVEEARAGQRTAVNVQGLDRDAIPRGSTLAAPGSLPSSRRIWARLRLLEDAPEDLGKKGGLARLHHGTCDREARIRVLRRNEDGSLAAEIRLDEKTVLLPGDRFILRRPAPVDTLGGGEVVDVRPPRTRRASLSAFDLDVADRAGRIRVRLSRAGLAGRSPQDLAGELGWVADEFERQVRQLVESGDVVAAAGFLFESEAWNGLKDGTLRELERYHQTEPLRRGMSREALRGRVCREIPQEAWRVWLETMVRQGHLRLEGEWVALAGHRVVLSGEDKALADRIEAAFRDAGLDPPEPNHVLAAEGGGRAERLLDLLVSDGRLVRIRDGRPFHAEALETLKRKLGDYAKKSRTIDVAAFKQLAGVTRKNAIPLLEHLDAERVTRRVGNVREILDV
jgi:selenocysteine-specific elongation factor